MVSETYGAFEEVYNGGSTGDDYAKIWLYPYSDVVDSCKTGGVVASAIDSLLQEFVYENAITGYEIQRFKGENYTWPENHQATGIESDFDIPEALTSINSLKDAMKDYLKYDAVGLDLWERAGVHHLVHTDSNACSTGEDYAPRGAGGWKGDHNNTALNTTTVTWAPYCPDNIGITKNAAVQEPVHALVSDKYDNQWMGDKDDQHRLGTIRDGYWDDKVTPMLTYHWDDDKARGGTCSSTIDYPTGYDSSVTYCTVEAMKKTSENL